MTFSQGIAGDVKGPVFPICASAMFYFMMVMVGGCLAVMVPQAYLPGPCVSVGEPDRDESAHRFFEVSNSTGTTCMTYMSFLMTYECDDRLTMTTVTAMQCFRKQMLRGCDAPWPEVDACRTWCGCKALQWPHGDDCVVDPSLGVTWDGDAAGSLWSCPQCCRSSANERAPVHPLGCWHGIQSADEQSELDALWLMQRGKGKDNKRRRSPTPRRRRIPARPRQQVEPSQRQYRRAAWARTPTRPTCSQSWVDVPWRRHRAARSRGSREDEPEHEEEEGEPAINLTAGPSTPAAAPPPLPPFEDGIRTWGELIGILDPMDDPESVIDPLVVENGVDRIRRMGSEERGQLALQLVRFLAILYAEILRMLQMAEQGEGEETSMLQVSHGGCRSPRGFRAPKIQYHAKEAATWAMDDVVQFMQTPLDKFGTVLTKLMGLLEKMSQTTAATRANFLRSMLQDVQRPGLHISASVIDKMDRLQALLLSFDEGEAREVADEDREWCFRQWEAMKAILLDKTKEAGAATRESSEQASSSTEIVCLEDSQEPHEDHGYQVAVLPNGTKRPMTEEEAAEVAYHEELEASAADREARADEQRWLEYRAQVLREQEEKDMQEALEESATDHVNKKARVLVQVEGEGGRVVRSEVFNMVVEEGEVLTYKIMVLPRDDPEVRVLRRQQQRRDATAQTGDQDSDSSGSAASADTLPTDEAGRLLPEPAAVPDEDLEKFMRTEEGNAYYMKWLQGEITCKMVRERSGCGLLAKFFSRKVDEEENQKMLQLALQAEHDHGTDQARLDPGQDQHQALRDDHERPAAPSSVSGRDRDGQETSAARPSESADASTAPPAMSGPDRDGQEESTARPSESADASTTRSAEGTDDRSNSSGLRQSDLKLWLL